MSFHSKLLFIVPFIILGRDLFAQDNGAISVNEVRLHSPIERFQDDLDFYTGNESFYDGNEGLAAIVKRNWENGLKEGVYYGEKYTEVNGYQAQKMSFIFFKDILFKLRWTFQYSAETKISVLAPELTTFLTSKFGEPEVNDFGFVKNTIWTKDNYKIMLFQEGKAIATLELRDDEIQKEVDEIK
ncbi:MAG: hypothetical protein AAF363_22120 [Bacteroidota bacterium]